MTCENVQLVAMVFWLGAVIVIGMVMMFVGSSLHRRLKAIDILIAEMKLSAAVLSVERSRK